MEKTASLRPVLLDKDAHPAPTCLDSRSAQSLCALRSHFCRCSFCLEARDGPPLGVGTAVLGDTEQGGVKAEFGKAEVGCVPGSGGAPTQAKLRCGTFIGRSADLPPFLISSLACSLPGLGGPWPVPSRIWDHDQEGTEDPRHGEGLLLWPHLGGDPTRQPLPPRGHLYKYNEKFSFSARCELDYEEN